jgi:uncharacterized protein (TIGR00369 family)
MSANEEIVRSVVVGSPYGNLLGLRVEAVGCDEVRIRLPYRADVVTVGDTVHGGAIASLVDTAATAAVWTGVDLREHARGATVAFAVTFLAAARGQDVVATARVIHRGRTLCTCDVEVAGGSGEMLARGLVTYKVG